MPNNMNNDAKSVQDALKKFLDKTKAKHFQSDRNDMVKEISTQVMNSFTPVLKSLAENSRISKEELASVIREIKIVAPEVKMPEIHIPEPKVTVNYTPPPVNVNVPKQEQQKFPESMRVIGDMNMPNVDRKSPLPVIMIDQLGKPMEFAQSASGGKGDFFTIVDIKGSTASLIDQVEGALKVTGNFTVSGSATSTLAVGDSPARTADNGGNPLKIGGIARTTNPTAYSDGDRSNIGTDSLGRMITRPLQVRGLIATAYASASTGAETTILASGGSGVFHDCIMITGTNASTASVTVDIRDTTAGSIVHTMVIPASTGPIGFSPSVPYPQSNANNNWTFTIQGSDISNTSVYFTGLFSKEI